MHTRDLISPAGAASLLRPVDRPFLDAARASAADIKAVAHDILDVVRFVGGFAVAAVVGASLLGAFSGKAQK